MSQVQRNQTSQPDNLKPYTPIPSLKTLFSLLCNNYQYPKETPCPLCSKLFTDPYILSKSVVPAVVAVVLSISPPKYVARPCGPVCGDWDPRTQQDLWGSGSQFEEINSLIERQIEHDQRRQVVLSFLTSHFSTS